MTIFVCIRILFSPYSYISDSDINFVSPDTSDGTPKSFDINKYIKKYPILREFQLFNNNFSNQKVLNYFLYKYYHEDIKDVYDILIYIIDNMPAENDEIRTFDKTYLNNFENDPLLIKIMLKYPKLFEKGTPQVSKLCKIVKVLDDKNIKEIEKLFNNGFYELIDNKNICECLKDKLVELFQYFDDNGELFSSKWLQKFFSMLLFKIPETMFSLNLNNEYDAKEDYYLLSFPDEIKNKDFVGSIKYYKFSYYLIKSLANNIDEITVKSLVPLHRLTLSKQIGIDALLYGLNQHPEFVKSIIDKAKDYKVRLFFASIIATLMTCVEIPFLKTFIINNHLDLLNMFQHLLVEIQNSIIKNKFQLMVNLLLCHGTDALSRVYCYWLGKQLDSTYQLLKVSPFEPAFSALLLENSSEIASNPRIACKIFRKKYFYLSTPIISSMKAVAKKIDLITYMKYAVNESTKYNDIFTTVELI